MPRYFGWVHKDFSGSDNAAEYSSYARTLLGGLHEYTNRVMSAVRYVTLANGVRIAVAKRGAVNTISVYSPAPFERRLYVSECGDFASGLVSAVSVTESKPPALEWMYPSGFQTAISPNISHPTAVTNFANPSFISTEAGLPATYTYIAASEYSGLLRKAMQIFQGAGTELVKTYGPGGVVPIVAYGFQGTIGLIVSEWKSGVPKRVYSVRMPTVGSPYGILIKRETLCGNLTDAQIAAGVTWRLANLPVFPEGAALNKAVGSGAVIEILSLSAYTAAMQGYTTPMYSDCGWAFSYAGDKCAAVLKKPEGNGSDRSALFEVTFAFSSTAPFISASVSLVESGIYYMQLSQAPRFPIKVPYPTLLPHNFSYNPAPVNLPATRTCPVHAFYGLDGALKLFRYSIAAPTSGTTYSGNTAAEMYWIGRAIGQPGFYQRLTHNPGVIQSWYSLNGVAITANQRAGSGSFFRSTIADLRPPYDTFMEHQYNINPWLIAPQGFSARSRRAWTGLYDSQTASSSYYNYINLFVPLYNREACIVFDSEYRWVGYRTNYASVLGQGRCLESAYVGEVTTCPGQGAIIPIPHEVWKPLEGEVLQPYYVAGYGSGSTDGWQLDCVPSYTDPLPPYNLGTTTTYTPSPPDESTAVMYLYTPGISPQKHTFGARDTSTGVGSTSYAIDLYANTAYVNYPFALYAWTDAFNPDMAIWYKYPNTSSSDYVINSTAYDLSGMSGVMRLFVGIAN